jgi:hypothetical protein
MPPKPVLVETLEILNIVSYQRQPNRTGVKKLLTIFKYCGNMYVCLMRTPIIQLTPQHL